MSTTLLARSAGSNLLRVVIEEARLVLLPFY
jgi:hypothetical protein